MSRKKVFYIVFFVALALGFYFILTSLVPELGRKRINPVSHIIPFSFTTQDGAAFTEKDVAGKVYLAEYFFTTCPGICPDMNKNMKIVYDELKENPDFLILSHTSMPEVDSPATLKKYAEKMDVDTRKWVFLTGRKDSLYKLARVAYTIDDPNNNLTSIQDQFIHSQYWALVDKKGDIVKIYDGLLTADVKKAIKHAKRLLKEKVEP